MNEKEFKDWSLEELHGRMQNYGLTWDYLIGLLKAIPEVKEVSMQWYGDKDEPTGGALKILTHRGSFVYNHINYIFAKLIFSEWAEEMGSTITNNMTETVIWQDIGKHRQGLESCKEIFRWKINYIHYGS